MNYNLTAKQKEVIENLKSSDSEMIISKPFGVLRYAENVSSDVNTRTLNSLIKKGIVGCIYTANDVTMWGLK